MKNCTYCGSSLNIQNDHIIARTKGGVSTIPACAKCNQSKGKKAMMGWFRWLKINNTYRWKRITDFHFRKQSDISIKVRKVRDEK